MAGLGVSHFELIRLMLRKGISVTVLDKREMAALGEDGRILEKLPNSKVSVEFFVIAEPKDAKVSDMKI